MKRWLWALTGVMALVGLLWVWSELHRPYRHYSGNLVLVIEPGTRATAVAGLLVRRGVLAARLPFLFRYWLGRPRHGLKAGEYIFDRPLPPIEVYRKLIQGDVYLHPVIIPEGSDRFDIARILHQQLGINPEEFLRATDQTSALRDLDPRALTLEGYLFPDTYRFARGVRSATVVEAMLARFRQLLDSKLPHDLHESSGGLHELITLASLVEKETPNANERPIIAGVFVRRLKKGWSLECDPTVVYAIRLSYPLVGHSLGPLTQRDLNFESPYNTYRHPGLPPGPICSPGQASLRAALNPAASNFLYFVSNNHGGHVFARTLAEHRRNVARYRSEVAARRRVVPEGRKLAQQPLSKNPRGGTDATIHSTKSDEHKK